MRDAILPRVKVGSGVSVERLKVGWYSLRWSVSDFRVESARKPVEALSSGSDIIRWLARLAEGRSGERGRGVMLVDDSRVVKPIV